MTNIFVNILLITAIIQLLLLLYNVRQRIKNNQIKSRRDKEQKELLKLHQQITKKQNRILQLKSLEQQEQNLLNIKRENRQNELGKIEENYERQLIEYRQNFHQNIRQQQILINQEHEQHKQQLQQQIKKIQDERNQVQTDLEQLKSVYQAATAARLRQQEEEDKIAFYCIKISEKQIDDIINLQEWKKELNDPSIVSKIIWSAFIMKPTTDLCNRVLGSGSVCGIYKITNKQTGDIYIGQSVNVADRWKQHVKCGLGIDASTTNKLYNNMQKYGVWNFTFEILQKCTRDKLNEKERFWIQMYQSNKVGLNVTKGNK